MVPLSAFMISSELVSGESACQFGSPRFFLNQSAVEHGTFKPTFLLEHPDESISRARFVGNTLANCDCERSYAQQVRNTPLS